MENIKLREKIGYGLGDAASSMFWKLFTMYLLFFYTDVVGISSGCGRDDVPYHTRLGYFPRSVCWNIRRSDKLTLG